MQRSSSRFVAAVKGELTAGELLPDAPASAERESRPCPARVPGTRGNRERSRRPTPSAMDWRGCWARWSRSSSFPVWGSLSSKRSSIAASACSCAPPSRLFGDAGLETIAARAMPIRLDASGGIMGGAFMPPAQTPRFRDLLEQRLDRLARRMAEAGLDVSRVPGDLFSRPRPTRRIADSGCTKRPTSSCRPGVAASEPPDLRLVTRCTRSAAGPASAGGSSGAATQEAVPRMLGRGRGPRRADDPENGRRSHGGNDVTPPPEPVSDTPDAMGEGSE